MNNRVKSLCLVPLPYPRVSVKKQDLRYAKMLSVPYAGFRGELFSILQYTYARLICEAKRPTLIADVFSYIAEVEMRHLMILGEWILAFGGVPRFSAADGRGSFQASALEYTTSADRLLARAAEDEKRSLEMYRRILRSMGDEAARQMVQRLILDEERHLAIFTELSRERPANKSQ